MCRPYTGYINARMRVTGHVWQGRFSSVAMDEEHLVCTLRYAALRKAESVGRLVGYAQWQADMEAHTGKQLAQGKPGRPKRQDYR